MDLSVIIVNYNVKYFLEHCLASVRAASQKLKVQVIVVDNNSTDDSQSYFANRYEDIEFIWNNKNLGFAKANNLGLKKAKGKYVLFLNPDTIVPEDCFEKCIQFFENNEKAGAIGVRMIDGSGSFLRESKRALPNLSISFYKLVGLANLFPRHKTFGKYHLGHLNENEVHEIDVLAGAFIMSKMSIIEKVGGFDETYFMYGEDVDLSYSIQKLGYKNFYLPEPMIIHFKGESTKKGSLNYVKIFYKAMSQFVTKYYSNNQARWYAGIIQAAIFIRAIFTGLVSLFMAVIVPFVDFCICMVLFYFVKKYFVYFNIANFDIIRMSLLIVSINMLAGMYFKKINYNNIISGLYTNLLFGTIVYFVFFKNNFSFIQFVSLVFIPAFILKFLVRFVLDKLGIISFNKNDNLKQVAINDDNLGLKSVADIIEKAGVSNLLISGFTSDAKKSEFPNLGSFSALNDLKKYFPFEEIIYTNWNMSFKEIIQHVYTHKGKFNARFHFKNTYSIIGSDDKNLTGKKLTGEYSLKEFTALQKFLKKVWDKILCIFAIVFAPFRLFNTKNIKSIFIDIAAILFGKKTWIGLSNNDINAGQNYVYDILSMQINTDNKLSEEEYHENFCFWTETKYFLKGQFQKTKKVNL